MYGYIYLTTNLVNGRKYIGQHKSNTFDSKYLGSGKILKQAILKEGVQNFTLDILEVCESKEQLDQAEAYYIQKYNAVESSDFYNLKEGGLGKSVKGLVYITNGAQCKKVFPEELEGYFALGWYKGGPRQSQETKDKRAASNRGKKHPTAGPNISKALTGRKRSPEQRVNMGKGMLGKPSPTRRAVYCEELDRTFDCIAHAAQYIGGRSPRISQCINGQCPTAYGYHWKAVEK